MNILIYSYNDKIGDGLQKITFIQQIKKFYPNSTITYTTTNTTTLKKYLNPLVSGLVDEFIENNEIQSSFIKLFKSNSIFENKYYDLIIDLQKVVLRTLNLKKIKHGKFISATANFLFSNIKNNLNLSFKKIYIEQFYFNLLCLIQNKKNIQIPNIELPKNYDIEMMIEFSDKNIAIAPGAGDEDRNWGFENYFEIALYLRSKGFNVFFFLGPQEKKYLNKCLENNFICPEWKNDRLISDNISFVMSLAKKMNLLLCNDAGTSWMFQFAGVKCIKIFGNTDKKKFSRPGFAEGIQTSDYGYNLKNFPIDLYKKKLVNYLNII